MAVTPTSSGLPWWWPHLVTGVCAVALIVLGGLDHLVAHDRWGTVTDFALIFGGAAAGGVDIGHYFGWQQTPPKS